MIDSFTDQAGETWQAGDLVVICPPGAPPWQGIIQEVEVDEIPGFSYATVLDDLDQLGPWPFADLRKV